MEQDTPPVNLQEALNATEESLDRMKEYIGRARSALQEGDEKGAWSAYREVVDGMGRLLGLVINDIRDLAPAEYFPKGMESILGIEQPAPEEEVEDGEMEDRLSREFDPHDYESRENIRLAIRRASAGGDLDVMMLGKMFAPPSEVVERFDSKDEMADSIVEAIWNQYEGMAPRELEAELQAVERAADNVAADLLDYATGRKEGSVFVRMIWFASQRANVLNHAIKMCPAYPDGLLPWSKLIGKEQEALRSWPDSPAELSGAAQDVLRGVLNWTDGRPEHLWPEHKKELYGHAGVEAQRDNWDKKHPSRPQNALENQLRMNEYAVPEDVEELVELARSTLNGR